MLIHNKLLQDLKKKEAGCNFFQPCSFIPVCFCIRDFRVVGCLFLLLFSFRGEGGTAPLAYPDSAAPLLIKTTARYVFKVEWSVCIIAWLWTLNIQQTEKLIEFFFLFLRLHIEELLKFYSPISSFIKVSFFQLMHLSLGFWFK